MSAIPARLHIGFGFWAYWVWGTQYIGGPPPIPNILGWMIIYSAFPLSSGICKESYIFAAALHAAPKTHYTKAKPNTQYKNPIYWVWVWGTQYIWGPPPILSPRCPGATPSTSTEDVGWSLITDLWRLLRIVWVAPAPFTVPALALAACRLPAVGPVALPSSF